MSTEFNLCPKCGGIKDPVPVAYPRAFGLCRCAPAQKHDGKLGTYSVGHSTGHSTGQFHYVRIQGQFNMGDDEISLSPAEALSLLAWLKQEEAELQRLAKEQEHG